jgi:hypothetical protein
MYAASVEDTLLANAARYFYDRIGQYYLDNFGDLEQ